MFRAAILGEPHPPIKGHVMMASGRANRCSVCQKHVLRSLSKMAKCLFLSLITMHLGFGKKGLWLVSVVSRGIGLRVALRSLVYTENGLANKWRAQLVKRSSTARPPPRARDTGQICSVIRAQRDIS